MKKIIIYISLALCLAVSFALPCFAYYNIENRNGQYHITFDGMITNGDLVIGNWVWVGDIPDFDPSVYSAVSYTLQGSAAASYSSSVSWDYKNGAYFAAVDGGDFEGESVIAYCPLVNYENVFTQAGFYVLALGAPNPVYYPVSVTISDPNADTGEGSNPSTPATGVYYEIFDTLHSFFYGADAELTAAMELTLTVIATTACLFAFALPFLVVFWVIKRWL